MQSPTIADPRILVRARGLNDQVSPVKLSMGYVPFACNMLAQSDVWERRAGRDWSERMTGMALGLFNVEWEDGTSFRLAQVGDVFYNLSVTFDYMVDTGYRWLAQSPDLNWWNLTPDTTTGAITPTVVTYTGTTISADLVITKYQLFGFRASSTKIYRVRLEALTASIIREEYGIASVATLYSTDQAYATGYGLVFEDLLGNRWRCTVDNGGIIVKTAL